MKCKKMTAFMLAAMMVTGSSMAVFAADGDPTNSATGEGTLLPHVDREITAVTFPTEAQVATVFDYNVDPEQLIKSAGKLLDGTTVTGNEDGVYFANAATQAVPGTARYTSTTNTGNYTVVVTDLNTNATYTYDGTTDNQWEDSEGNAASVTITITDDDNNDAEITPGDGDTLVVSGAVAAGTAGASSTSDAVKFEGKNSVDVDVTVTATVAAPAEGKKYITLVADAAALQASKTPALLMTLKVGNESKVITSAGTTATAKIEGVPTNFSLDVVNKAGSTTDREYKYTVKADASGWKSTTVQLSGKTNKVNVPTGDDALEVPQITLTWSVTKHVDSVLDKTTVSSTANVITVDSGISVSKITLIKKDTTNEIAVTTSLYTFSNNKLTFTSSFLSNNVGGKLKVTLSNGKTEEITIQ